MSKIAQRSTCEVKLSEIKYTFKRKSYKNYVKNDVNWDSKQEEILDTILKGGYVEDLECLPAISSDYICVDGHHRLFGLNSIHDGDYKIKVFKYKNSWFNIVFFSIFYLLCYKIINYFIKN